MTTKSHAANFAKSDRLKSLFASLKSGEAKTTAQLQSETGSMAIHSDVHELRQNGFTINSKYSGRTADNRKIYQYQMVVNN